MKNLTTVLALLVFCMAKVPAQENIKVLMVLTSHDELGTTGKKTGFWIEEFATPYYFLKDKGVDITIATPKGGQAPIDPKSNDPSFLTESTIRYFKDNETQNKIKNTLKLSSVKEEQYDAVFYPGGHGPLWDLAYDKHSIALLESFNKSKKPMALICHAPSALKYVKDENGNPLVKGKKVAGFSNSEEEAVKLTKAIPFLVEDMLTENGGIYQKGPDWSSFVVKEGNLITGQNPQSSEEAVALLYNMVVEAKR